MMFPKLLIIFACVHLSYCIQSDVPAEDLIQTSPFTSSSDISVVNLESETVRIPSGGSSTLPITLDSSDSNQGDFVKTSIPNGRSVAKISWNPVNSAVSTEAFTKNTNDESTHLSKNVSNSLETDAAAVYHTTQSIYDNLDHGENELDSDVSKNTLKTTQNPDVLSLYKFDANSTENSTDIPFSVSTNSVLSRSDEELMSRIYVSSLPLSEYYTEAPTGSLTTLIDEYTANATILDSSIKLTSTSVTEVSNSALFTEGKDISSLLHESNVSSSKFFETTTDIFEKNKFEDLVTETNNTKDAILVTDSINHLNDLKPTISTSSELFDGKTFQQNSTIENFSTVTTLDPTANKQGFGLDIHTTFTEVSKVLEVKTTSFSEQSETSTLSSTSGLENTITDKSITEMFTAKHSDTLPPDTSPNITISISSTPILHIDSLSENFSEANTPKNNYEATTAEAIFSHSNSTSHLNESTYTENKTFTSSAYDLSKETETVHDSIIHSSTASVFTESEISIKGTTISSSLPEVTEIKKTLPLSTVSFTSDNMSLYTRTTSPTTDSLDVQEISIATDSEKDVSQFSTKSVTLSTENPTITHFPFSILMHFTGMSSSIDSDKITNMTQKATDISHEQNFPTTTASHLSSTIFGNPEDPNSSDIISTTVSSSTVKSTLSEQNIVVSQTISHPSSTTTDLTIISTDHNEYPISTFSSTEETTVSNTEGSKITDPVVTLLSDKYSSSAIPVSTATWTVPLETHREGKHIPFSSISTIDPTSKSSFRVVTTDKIPTMETTRNVTEIHYKQLEFEDLNSLDRTDMITAIIQFPANSVNKTGMKFKLAKTHIWLNDVLTKEFQNWTKDPFEESEEPINEKPFGNISIFYVMPTPETNASHITLTFIVYNAWKNETLPVHFVLGILNFYSKDLKESINASAAYFYHGLLTENYDLLSAMLEKYGIIIFTICLAVVGVTVLICVVIFYRRKTRQSVHYLADSKLQHNMQEAVGIDLTPASIILQDEKEEKGSKICDDEGWLVPITDVPLAEEINGPNVQDTKL